MDMVRTYAFGFASGMMIPALAVMVAVPFWKEPTPMVKGAAISVGAIASGSVDRSGAAVPGTFHSSRAPDNSHKEIQVDQEGRVICAPAQ